MSGVEEIVPGVYGIVIRLAGVPFVNAFLVDGEDADGGVSIVDTGMPKRAVQILGALPDIGRRPSDVRRIVLTHHHLDHTGSVRAIAAATGATVHVHQADAAIVRGERPAPPANRGTAAGWILGPVLDRVRPRYDPPSSVAELAGGDVLPFGGGAEVVHTPGHTPGHVSLLLASKRLLIAGDAAGCFRGRLGRSLGMFTEDAPAADASIRRLAALEFDTACFGHGTVLRDGANGAFRRLVEKLASKS